MEFLRYPQVIRHHCNGGRFGPPWSFTSTSACSWIGHPVSGLWQRTLYALFRLALAAPSVLNTLSLLVTITRRTVLQKVRGCTRMVLPQFVNTGFQVLFHSPPGVLFTFPSQYSALSVTKEYLALRGGPRSFPQGFSCLVVLWILLCFLPFRLRGSHPLWPVFPEPFRYSQKS